MCINKQVHQQVGMRMALPWTNGNKR